MFFGVSIDLIARDNKSPRDKLWQQFHRVIETWRVRRNKFYRGSPECRFLIGFPIQPVTHARHFTKMHDRIR